MRFIFSVSCRIWQKHSRVPSALFRANEIPSAWVAPRFRGWASCQASYTSHCCQIGSDASSRGCPRASAGPWTSCSDHPSERIPFLAWPACLAHNGDLLASSRHRSLEPAIVTHPNKSPVSHRGGIPNNGQAHSLAPTIQILFSSSMPRNSDLAATGLAGEERLQIAVEFASSSRRSRTPPRRTCFGCCKRAVSHTWRVTHRPASFEGDPF